MKRKLVLRLLSLSLAAAVTGTMFPSSVYFVNAELVRERSVQWKTDGCILSPIRPTGTIRVQHRQYL